MEQETAAESLKTQAAKLHALVNEYKLPEGMVRAGAGPAHPHPRHPSTPRRDPPWLRLHASRCPKPLRPCKTCTTKGGT